MRVISQDGSYEFNYENSILYSVHSLDKYIIKHHLANTDNDKVVALYSTETAMENALYQMRQEYKRARGRTWADQILAVMTKIWQFPKDSKEVWNLKLN